MQSWVPWTGLSQVAHSLGAQEITRPEIALQSHLESLRAQRTVMPGRSDPRLRDGDGQLASPACAGAPLGGGGRFESVCPATPLALCQRAELRGTSNKDGGRCRGLLPGRRRQRPLCSLRRRGSVFADDHHLKDIFVA